MNSSPLASLLVVVLASSSSLTCNRHPEAAVRPDGGDEVAGFRPCSLPRCVAELANGCRPAGECLYDAVSPMDSRFCYANGVEVRSTVEANGAVLVTVTRPDRRTRCWSVERVGARDTAGGAAALSYRDATGKQVATGTIDSTKQELAIACVGSAPQAVDWDCRGIGETGIAGGQLYRCAVGGCP